MMSSSQDAGLGLNAPIERRDLLGGMLVGTGFVMMGCAPASSGKLALMPEPQDQPGYYPPRRTGLRGNHPGSFENAHALRDGTLTLEQAEQTGENYDLVVVGGGISGLSAAYFLRAARPDARILILDNHDDFGGHAKRNEFVVDGHTLLVNGGTMLISSPRPYGPISFGLLQDLGIDAEVLSKTYKSDDSSEGLKLGRAIYFDRETFGGDGLTIMPTGRGADTRAALVKALAQSPLSARAQADFVRLQFDKVDYLPGLDEAAKRKRLSRMSYRSFLADLVKMDPAAIAVFQTRTHGEWGIGIDAEPALDCWGIGLPGLDGMGLDRSNTDMMGNTAAGYGSTGGSPSFHFPDGNATIARAQGRRLGAQVEIDGLDAYARACAHGACAGVGGAQPPVTGGKNATSAPAGTGVASSAITWLSAQRSSRSRLRAWAWAPPRAISWSRSCAKVTGSASTMVSAAPSASRRAAK